MHKEQYRKYLQSYDWLTIKQKVLERADYVCEGCQEQKATEVHHMTYKHIGNEFLFELLALCKDCHRRYHNGNNGQHK